MLYGVFDCSVLCGVFECCEVVCGVLECCEMLCGVLECCEVLVPSCDTSLWETLARGKCPEESSVVQCWDMRRH